MSIPGIQRPAAVASHVRPLQLQADEWATDEREDESRQPAAAYTAIGRHRIYSCCWHWQLIQRCGFPRDVIASRSILIIIQLVLIPPQPGSGNVFSPVFVCLSVRFSRITQRYFGWIFMKFGILRRLWNTEELVKFWKWSRTHSRYFAILIDKVL